jgi:hypothetical protein
MSNLVPHLAKLAKRINALYARVETAARSVVADAKEAGELLLKAKEQCPHGQWRPWIEANFAGSLRTAQKWMRLAEGWPELEANAPSTALLTIEQALEYLAEPREEESREEEESNRIVIEQADLDAALKAARVPKQYRQEALDHMKRECRPCWSISLALVGQFLLHSVGMAVLPSLAKARRMASALVGQFLLHLAVASRSLVGRSAVCFVALVFPVGRRRDWGGGKRDYSRASSSICHACDSRAHPTQKRA